MYINEELEKKDLTLTKLEKRLSTSNEDKSKLSTDNQQLTLRIQELNSEIETLANHKKNGLGSANSVAERLRDENSQLKEEIEQYMVMKTSLVEKTEECHILGLTVAGLKESLEAERQKLISGQKSELHTPNKRSEKQAGTEMPGKWSRSNSKPDIAMDQIDLNEARNLVENMEILGQNYDSLKQWVLYLINGIFKFVDSIERNSEVSLLECLSNKEIDEMDISGVVEDFGIEEKKAKIICVMCSEKRDPSTAGKKFLTAIQSVSHTKKNTKTPDEGELLVQENVSLVQDNNQMSKKIELLEAQMKHLKDEYLRAESHRGNLSSFQEISNDPVSKSEGRLGSQLAVKKWDQSLDLINAESQHLDSTNKNCLIIINDFLKSIEQNPIDTFTEKHLESIFSTLATQRTDFLTTISHLTKENGYLKKDYASLKKDYNRLEVETEKLRRECES